MSKFYWGVEIPSEIGHCFGGRDVTESREDPDGILLLLYYMLLYVLITTMGRYAQMSNCSGGQLEIQSRSKTGEMVEIGGAKNTC